MTRVRCPDGTVEETDSLTALAYYQREPGYEILDGLPPEVGAVTVDTPTRPADSALKPEWVDYALTTDPDNAEWIQDHSTTKDELIDAYGGD